MIMKKFYFSTIIGCFFALISCKYHCPSFDKDVLSWIPYQKNDVVELYSESYDSTIIFSIKSVNVLHQTEYSYNSKCGTCDDFIEITQNTNDNFDFLAQIFLHKNKMQNQYYRIDGTSFSTYLEYNEYVVDVKEYGKTRVFEADFNQTFKSLIIVKGIGIVGLVDKNDQLWVLKNGKTKKSKEGKEVIIKETSC